MAMSNHEFWEFVAKDEQWMQRIDLAVATWMNQVAGEAANVANHQAKAKFLQRSPSNPRPFTTAIKWIVSGATPIRAATNPLDAVEITDVELFQEVRPVMDFLAIEGAAL